MSRSRNIALSLALSAACAAPAAPAGTRPAAGPVLGRPPRAVLAPAWLPSSSAKLEAELAAKYGESQRARLRGGLRQLAGFWRAADGDAAAFEQFVRSNFAGEPAMLDAMLERFERALESIDGHMDALTLALHSHTDLDAGPILPFDEAFAGYDPAAHLQDDFFGNKLSFAVLLNFPATTLQERLALGAQWTRRQWAQARLTQRFSRRLPAEVALGVARAQAQGAQYIAGYNIWMRHLVDKTGHRLFPPGLRLLSHWNLRDEIKADYADAAAGLAKQRMIAKVMERIVTQTIPASVIDNPRVDWDPEANAVHPALERDSDAPAPAGAGTGAAPEPDRRYALILENFRAARKADPYSPIAPTMIARSFDEEREIPEPRVRAMLEQVLASPVVPRVARLIERRLGRKLEPFDVWYDGFRPRGAHTEAQLDARVARKYPTAEAYRKDIPDLLRKLGFSGERSDYLAAHIVVDPARGSGHAWGPKMRSEPAHLRTRVEKGGMNYKGFNIAVHEMGHNVEQIFSLYSIDHTLLQGVPNNAFTEALAFVFQGRDLGLLGLAPQDRADRALKTLGDFWATYEIAGAALIDMELWRWMYGHPGATPAQLKEAAIQASRRVWNRYYSPVLGGKDSVLLGVYSHMVEYPLYLPDYPIGHMIAFQIEEHMEKAGSLGAEFERMARLGRLSPDLWMTSATGAPVGPQALLAATEKALETLSP